ncbi:TetR/AcrR family transcriptional regulator [Aquamicrobium sp. LC103]|uniref:TetR/AcrR family transcriptional regulator n=1 Tax=Aquamicrobium sp. LC103 TaxID=1120658 RepID=UPI00063E9BAD|nr:TetR/AcrR family transcriptional regulator [Aquamicrobium sp. LC103]TKT81131.1 TetR/AcrR family transcriptional regulator [Aquamicrobium sp. LC103]
MAHRPRTEMIAETRTKLIAAGRRAFGTVGYADASMDDFTAEAGLTRGALYHHFGGKKGLLEAVVAELDREMSERTLALASKASDPWEAFLIECTCYLDLALDPEIQRIVHRDGPAVLGDPSLWASQDGCIASMTKSLRGLKEEGYVRDDVDPEAAARLISGASLHAAQWIANSDDAQKTSAEAVKAYKALLEGLLEERHGKIAGGRAAASH